MNNSKQVTDSNKRLMPVSRKRHQDLVSFPQEQLAGSATLNLRLHFYHLPQSYVLVPPLDSNSLFSFPTELHLTSAERHQSNNRCILQLPFQANIEAVSARNWVSEVNATHGFIRRDIPIFPTDDSGKSLPALLLVVGMRRAGNATTSAHLVVHVYVLVWVLLLPDTSSIVGIQRDGQIVAVEQGDYDEDSHFRGDVSVRPLRGTAVDLTLVRCIGLV